MFNRRCFSRFPRVINSFPTEEDQKSEQTERQTSPVIELACQGTFVTGTAPTPGLGNRQGSTVTTKKFTIGSSDPATWVGGGAFLLSTSLNLTLTSNSIILEISSLLGLTLTSILCLLTSTSILWDISSLLDFVDIYYVDNKHYRWGKIPMSAV